MSPLDRMNCTVLGLDVETLLFYSSSTSFSTTSTSSDANAISNDRNNNNDNNNKIAELIELAKRTPALLMYEPGVERAGALMAAWQLMDRGRLEEEGGIEAHNPPHSHGHGSGYVLVRYISVDVVPLIDYWPPFVRDGFAGRGWRFVSVVDDDDHHEPITGGEGWGGDEGQGKGERVVFEILEFSLDVMEWLMTMEMEAGKVGGNANANAVGREDEGKGKGMWEKRGGKSEELGDRETETETETGTETERRVRRALGRLRI